MASIMRYQCDSCDVSFKRSGGFPFLIDPRGERTFPMVPVAIELVDKILSNLGLDIKYKINNCEMNTKHFVDKKNI